MPGIKAKRKQLVRKTLMRAKAQGERAAEQRQESPEEYAQTEVQQGISDVAARTGNTAKSTARMSYRKFRAMQEKRKNLTLQGSTQSASKPTEKEKVTVPTQTERREMFKKQRFRQKAIAAKTPAPQAPVPSSATPAPPRCRVQMQQRLKRQHLTREAVRRYLQKQTTATAAGNTAPIVTHAPKLPTISNKQATVDAISRGIHYITAKIKTLRSQTVRRAAQSLLALLGAGGVVLLLAMVIGAAAAVIGSPMGILFADESGDPNSIPIAEIVADTNADFGAVINDIVSAHPECSETTITYDYEDGHTWAGYWPEVLAVYAVKTTTDPDDPQEVATVDDSKKAILKDIFWQMNEISSHIERKPGKIITETDDGHGNIVETITTVTHTYLYITVSHKTAAEMADRFNFNADQRQQLSELLAEENRSMWSAVLYGIYSGDDAIVTVALSQIGNVGGQPYWSWYGFNSRVEWCACFVSWCADQCGYIDTGVVPKYAGCVNGVQWFKDRGQWIDGSAEPVPGMIIFFDWDNKGSSGPQDGQSDHTGIVQKVENGIVYTVEGNSGDSCRVNQYSVGHYEILGYGVPNY